MDSHLPDPLPEEEGDGCFTARGGFGKYVSRFSKWYGNDMTDLQLSLIGAGVAFVGSVYAYNKWQERKHRKLAERVFRTEHDDVLLGNKIAAKAPDTTPQDSEPARRVEPIIGKVAPTSALVPSDEPPSAWLDAGIDCVVRFESTDIIGGGYLWQAQQQALAKLSKPVTWVGYNERSHAWEIITAHGAGDYRRLRAGLLLADRRGPVSDAELTLFSNGVHHIADEFLAVADMPERGEMLAVAEELDRFCAGVDIQIGVNVVAAPGVSFAGTKLRAVSEAAGLTLREDGMFHACDESGNTSGTTLYMLSNLEPSLFVAEEMKTLTTQGITFTLDVPRVADGKRAFDRMVELAQRMAESLGGSVVDDNRTPLGGTALDVIRDKIVEVEERMTAKGLPAGGPQALRLFS